MFRLLIPITVSLIFLNGSGLAQNTANPADTRPEAQVTCSQAGMESLPESDALVAACTRVLASGTLKPAERTEAKYVRGYALYTRGYLLAAEQALREVIAEEPKHARAAHWLAMVLVSRRGNYAMARALLERTISIEPQYARHHYTLGLVYRWQFQYKLAIPHYTRAIELKPDFAWARHRRIFANAALNRWDQVLVDSSYLMANADSYGKITDPSMLGRQVGMYVAAVINHAKALRRLGRFDEGEARLNKLVAKTRTAVTLTARASYLRLLPFGPNKPPRWADSNRDARAAIALDPKISDAYHVLGLNLYRQKSFSESAAAFEAAIASNEEKFLLPDLHWARGRSLREAQRKSEAVASALTAFQLSGQFHPYFASQKLEEIAARGYFQRPKNMADLERAVVDAVTACMNDSQCF